MQPLWQAFVNTPWWVYFLFAYLLKVGAQASKTRVVALKWLFIMPAIFLVMSLHTLLASVQLTLFTVAVWALAILIGTVIGAWQVQWLGIQVDKTHYLFRLPGTWSTLVNILIIFAAKYYFGYQRAVDPQLVVDTSFELSLLAITGIFSGLFVGRLLYYLYYLKMGSHVDLVASK